MADASIAAAQSARALGVPVMLDAGRMRAGMTDVAMHSDYLVASEEFARDLVWDVTPEHLERERERLGVRAVTVTLGDRGSVTASSDSAFLTPAFPVEAVDTTGAGDVFHGGIYLRVASGLAACRYGDVRLGTGGDEVHKDRGEGRHPQP